MHYVQKAKAMYFPLLFRELHLDDMVQTAMNPHDRWQLEIMVQLPIGRKITYSYGVTR